MPENANFREKYFIIQSLMSLVWNSYTMVSLPAQEIIQLVNLIDYLLIQGPVIQN